MSDQPKDFSRQELRLLCRRAEEMAATPHIVPVWARAYLALADAADKLDAMHARTEMRPTPTKGNDADG